MKLSRSTPVGIMPGSTARFTAHPTPSVRWAVCYVGVPGYGT